MRITTLGLDADDTLWHNETIFRLTQARFLDLLTDHDNAVIAHRLAEVERRNLRLYGYGVKGFTLSMIETAMELCDGNPPSSAIREILAAGREMLAHPVETLPGVAETLAQLTDTYRLVLVTKGDLMDQERKLAASGLGELFSGVEIVSEKDPATVPARKRASWSAIPCAPTCCRRSRPAPGGCIFPMRSPGPTNWPTRRKATRAMSPWPASTSCPNGWRG